MLLTTSRKRRSRMTSRSHRLFGANAAFLQDIKEDEQEVSEVMTAVRYRLKNTYLDRFAVAELLDLLERLCQVLEHRFCLEETIGYMDDIVRIAPQLSEDAESLESEHRPLSNQLKRVLQLAETLCRRGDATASALAKMQDAFACFCDQYNAHEAREGDLIIDLLYFDIGRQE